MAVVAGKQVLVPTRLSHMASTRESRSVDNKLIVHLYIRFDVHESKSNAADRSIDCRPHLIGSIKKFLFELSSRGDFCARQSGTLTVLAR